MWNYPCKSIESMDSGNLRVPTRTKKEGLLIYYNKNKQQILKQMTCYRDYNKGLFETRALEIRKANKVRMKQHKSMNALQMHMWVYSSYILR